MARGRGTWAWHVGVARGRGTWASSEEGLDLDVVVLLFRADYVNQFRPKSFRKKVLILQN
jgi:hypothetical protein